MPGKILLILLMGATIALGQDAPTGGADSAYGLLQDNLNVVWTLMAAILVFFMQAGFAMVEAGLTRAKNAVNIIMKNLMDFAVGSLIFFLLGFGLMFGESGGFLGTTRFGLAGASGSDWIFTFLIFQTVFAATAATIVSGAIAERTKFVAYLACSVAVTGLIYPVYGAWAWGSLLDGNGWLENLPTGAFMDFAGSSVVHSVGGWIALAGAIVIGPRLGKFGRKGKINAIPGHNIPLASLGVFILWFGWFGFNAGSTTVGDGAIGRVAVTTNLAAAAGTIGATATAWLIFGKPDLTMGLNGALAGLVSITAGTFTVTPAGSIWIGLIGGILVVLSVLAFERILKIDDPVGAISVHGVCGLWGTLACGLFSAEAVLNIGSANTGLFYGGGLSQLISQFIGAGVAFVWAFGMGLVLFKTIQATIGLRVTEAEEVQGLDIGEHGMESYAGFQIFVAE